MQKILAFTNHAKWLITLWVIDTVWYIVSYTLTTMLNSGADMAAFWSSISGVVFFGYPLYKLFVSLYSLLFVIGGFLGNEKTLSKKLLRIGIVLGCYIVQVGIFAMINGLFVR